MATQLDTDSYSDTSISEEEFETVPAEALLETLPLQSATKDVSEFRPNSKAICLLEPPEWESVPFMEVDADGKVTTGVKRDANGNDKQEDLDEVNRKMNDGTLIGISEDRLARLMQQQSDASLDKFVNRVEGIATNAATKACETFFKKHKDDVDELTKIVGQIKDDLKSVSRPPSVVSGRSGTTAQGSHAFGNPYVPRGTTTNEFIPSYLCAKGWVADWDGDPDATSLLWEDELDGGMPAETIFNTIWNMMSPTVQSYINKEASLADNTRRTYIRMVKFNLVANLDPKTTKWNGINARKLVNAELEKSPIFVRGVPLKFGLEPDPEKKEQNKACGKIYGCMRRNSVNTKQIKVEYVRAGRFENVVALTKATGDGNSRILPKKIITWSEETNVFTVNDEGWKLICSSASSASAQEALNAKGRA